jgi:predicted PurR-regulated permease PerM
MAMANGNSVSPRHPTDSMWMTRERSMTLALIVATGIALYLCYRIASPFFPALAWALALAIIVQPVERRIRRLMNSRNVSSAVVTILAALVIGVPVIFVTQQLAREATRSADSIRENIQSGEWRNIFDRWPSLTPALPWIESQLGVPTTTSENVEKPQDRNQGELPQSRKPTEGELVSEGSVQQVVSAIGYRIGGMIGSVAWLGMQAFITLMSLFFFLRDRHEVIATLRSLLPLSSKEVDDIFQRVDDTIHATIFGSVMVACVQGLMGGLIFWWLNLPSPILWGAIMGLLAVVPVLGTFVIWAPTAVYLALQGHWMNALILASWGAIAIGLIDNFLYPYLVGKRLRFHTLLVFFAIVGGLATFGASGVILGPVLLAITDALIEVWRRRTAWGGTIEEGVSTSSP